MQDLLETYQLNSEMPEKETHPSTKSLSVLMLFVSLNCHTHLNVSDRIGLTLFVNTSQMDVLSKVIISEVDRFSAAASVTL